MNLSETDIPDLADYDQIGSGIYWGKHDRKLLDLVSGLPRVKGKKAHFSDERATSGSYS